MAKGNKRKKNTLQAPKPKAAEMAVKEDKLMYFCKDCEENYDDKIGHIQLIHERNVKEYTKDKHRKLLHCSDCLPDAVLFFLDQDLKQHMNEKHPKT